MSRQFNCDGCGTEIPYEPTTVYARTEGRSKRADFCVSCVKQRLDKVNWADVKKKTV